MAETIMNPGTITPSVIEGEDFTAFKASFEAKIRGAAMRESSEKLLRVMHLRQVKERLTPLGQWALWCQETGIDVRNADYEIGKLGDWKDDLLTKFVTYVGTDLNKIRYLTNSDYKKLGVTADNGQIMVRGEVVPLDAEEVQFVFDRLQDDLCKQKEKAAKERADIEKEQIETTKALRKAERELKKIKGDAEKKGLTPEEEGFLKEMESIRTDFDNLFVRLDPEAASERTMAAYLNTLDYMRLQIAGAYGTEVPRNG